MTENDYMSMTITELHALAQEIRIKLSYNPTGRQRDLLNKQLATIENQIDERYLDC